MDPNWAKRKAEAYRTAWSRKFGVQPSLNCVVLGCSVARHETRCGDAWPGADGILNTADDERNWGACTVRSLTPLERSVIAKAGIVPTVGPGHESRARAAMAALAEAGMPVASGWVNGYWVPRSVIHCDSSPEHGAYFTWFGAFDTDADGAGYFLHLLCGANGQRAARKVLEGENGTAFGLAQAMYLAGYYTGFHKKDNLYERPDGTPVKGSVLNIEAYATNIARNAVEFRAALLDEQLPAHAYTLRLGSPHTEAVKLWQDIIGVKADGVFGPKTDAATKAWQKDRGLKADGVVGPKTWAAAGHDTMPHGMPAVRQ